MNTHAHTTAELVRHVSRLEGQLAAVKRELQKNVPDCTKASNTLCAASRSFGSLRREFLRCFLGRQAYGKDSRKRVAYESLMRVVNS